MSIHKIVAASAFTHARLAIVGREYGPYEQLRAADILHEFLPSEAGRRLAAWKSAAGQRNAPRRLFRSADNKFAAAWIAQMSRDPQAAARRARLGFYGVSRGDPWNDPEVEIRDRVQSLTRPRDDGLSPIQRWEQEIAESERRARDAGFLPLRRTVREAVWNALLPNGASRDGP